MMPLERGPGQLQLDVSETARLAYQPDIYQRYSFLRGLTRGLVRGDNRASVLDVGSGPVRLTEVFLGSAFDVVRADVERFDTADIQVVVPGQPLPFDSAAFDLVLALEVLEHIPPSDRPLFVRELERVSRNATIVCCPVATAETIDAERRFSEWAVAIAGRDVDFLVEHREMGLPDVGDVVSWFASPGDLLVAENAPLDDWLAFNLLDLIYAADFGDTAEKQRFDTGINKRAPLTLAGAPHYRRFFCAIGDPVAADAARRFIQESSAPRHASELLSEMMSAVVDLRYAIRSRFGADLTAKDAANAHLASQLDQLGQAVGSLQTSLASKEAVIAQLMADVARLDELVSALHADLRHKDAELEGRNLQLVEKDSAMTDLKGQVESLGRSFAAQQAVLHHRQGELDEVRERLRNILGSRSWRVTAPARALGGSVRRAADVARRFARLSPKGSPKKAE